MEDKKVLAKIIVSSQNQSYCFDLNSYKEEYLKNSLSKEEYQNILKIANKIMYQCIVKKKKNDEIKLPMIMKILSVVSVIFGFVYSILLLMKTSTSPSTKSSETSTMNTSSESQDKTYNLLVNITSFGSVCILGFMSIFNFFRPNKTFRTLDYFFDFELKKYFNEVNKKYIEDLEFNFVEGKNKLEILIYKINNPNIIRNYENLENEENIINNNESGLDSSNRSASRLITPNKNGVSNEIELSDISRNRKKKN